MAKKIKKRIIEPDPLYNNSAAERFINYLMRRGKKATARRVFYDCLKEVQKKTEKDPLEILDLALKNAAPMLEVKSKRVGGAVYQVPMQVKGDKRMALAMRWIIQAAKSQKGQPMRIKLAKELIDASQNTGTAVKKKENLHKMAEANRAFAHFA